MPNPYYNRMTGSRPNNTFSPLGQMQSLKQQFEQFLSTFQGDPREQVQRLLDSGQMTQEQFNYLSNMAKAYQNMFK